MTGQEKGDLLKQVTV